MPHAPKSVLRYRPIEPDTSNTSAQIQEPPQVPRASQSHARPASRLRKKTRVVPTTTTVMRPASVHWSVSFGVGLLLMLVLFFIGQHVVSALTLALDDLHYGRPRTFQIDAVVGHQDSAANPSHFVVLNLRGHIDIIELPGGDPAHAHLYAGPQLMGPHVDLTPATLRFADLHHDPRHPDMVLLVQGTQIIFRNEQGAFHPIS